MSDIKRRRIMLVCCVFDGSAQYVTMSGGQLRCFDKGPSSWDSDSRPRLGQRSSWDWQQTTIRPRWSGNRMLLLRSPGRQSLFSAAVGCSGALDGCNHRMSTWWPMTLEINKGIWVHFSFIDKGAYFQIQLHGLWGFDSLTMSMPFLYLGKYIMDGDSISKIRHGTSGYPIKGPNSKTQTCVYMGFMYTYSLAQVHRYLLAIQLVSYYWGAGIEQHMETWGNPPPPPLS